MNILIRTIETNDYNEIYELIRNELGYSNLIIENTFKRIDAIRNHKEYQTFVAVYNNKVIGFIGLFKGMAFNIEGEHLQIIALAINKEYQNKGIGTQLLDEAEKYAQNENINSISLHSGLQREEAHVFYEHRGFVKKSYNLLKRLK